MIEQVIEGLPLHFQKEETIKFFKTLKPVLDYLNELTEELKNQTSLLECSGIFLDFMGDRYEEKRAGRLDEPYRQALITKKSALDGLPNTEFLLEITRKLTKNEVIAVDTRYKNEVASQLFRVDMTDKLKNIETMPDLNKICEAGAIMYWDLKIIENNVNLSHLSLVEVIREFDIKADFELDQTMRINMEKSKGIGIGFTKIIEIGGIK